MTLPTLFLSHGAPTLALDPTPARAFLQDLGRRLPRPKAILVVSAHWETRAPMVSATPRNATIHDFSGFARQLYEFSYNAPGAPELALKVKDRLVAAGFAAATHPTRGLDHGAWAPLMLIYREADIPVFQLSIQSLEGPSHHYRLGQALVPLREEGVLILASGSLTHNLGAWTNPDPNAPALAWVDAFADWTVAALEEGRLDDLLDYRARAPQAERNHPTDEHLLPLYVALGAAGEGGNVERLHRSATFGILRMDVFAFGGAAPARAAA